MRNMYLCILYAGGTQYQLTLLADHLTAITPLLGSIPDLRLALMAWEDNMVLVTDASGEAGCAIAPECLHTCRV